VASVVWRDGVHLSGTPIWCDARRRRDVCFVSAADRVGRAGHGQLIATPPTLALLGATRGGHLGVPLHQRFTLGTLRLELIASGRGPGGAALYVDMAGRTALYAGEVRAASADVRTADAVVVSAPHEREAPPLADLVARTREACEAQLARGVRPVLRVDSALDGVELASALGMPVAAARPIRDAAARIDLALAAPAKEPRTLIWIGDTKSIAQPHAIVEGFWWPRGDGPRALAAWIEATGAREVFVTGPAAEAIPGARVLGPPHQMTLGFA
jgi:hypothetical protein